MVLHSYAACHHTARLFTPPATLLRNCFNTFICNFNTLTLAADAGWHHPLPAGRPGSVPVLWPVVFQPVCGHPRQQRGRMVDPEDLTLLGPLGCGIRPVAGRCSTPKPVVGESLVVFGCGAVGSAPSWQRN